MMTSSSGAGVTLAALGLMLLVWLAAAFVSAMLIAIVLAPDHLGFAERLRGWEGQLPDPATFPQSVARLGDTLVRADHARGR